jgi:hypothetical protein
MKLQGQLELINTLLRETTQSSKDVDKKVEDNNNKNK